MVRINPQIFREYDIRGIVGEDLTEKTVYLIGRGYGSFLRQNHINQAVLGRDPRLSSYAYSRAICQGLCDAGVDVIDIGMVPTPLMYFARVYYEIEGGVMVTGSHNPPEFNGFKLGFGPDTLYGDGIQNILRIIEKGEFETGTGSVEYKDPLPAYVEDIASRITLGPKDLFCVVDAGNGATGPVVQAVFDRLGVKYHGLYLEPDGTFPNHHPDPTRLENLCDLIEAVKSQEADLGIAFDGDGDRIGVVDDSGKALWGDELQAVFWSEILPKHPGTLALIEVKCSQSLFDVVEELGGKPEFTQAGHSLIKARMRQTGALFAGELSGHMFFKDEYYGFDDAIYAAVRLLRLLSNSDRALSDFVAEFPKYCSTPEVRVYCPDEEKFKVVQQLIEDLSRDYEVVTVDGVRVILPYGWGLVRASNTQPALVLRAEAKTEDQLENIKSLIEEKLGQYPAVGVIEWN